MSPSRSGARPRRALAIDASASPASRCVSVRFKSRAESPGLPSPSMATCFASAAS